MHNPEKNGIHLNNGCEISGFRRSVKEIFALVGHYASQNGSFRRFGMCPSHLQGSLL
jgi:hypothetical protein